MSLMTLAHTLSRALAGEGIKHRTDLQGAQVTTFAIGGPLSLVIEPENPEQLLAALKILNREGANARVLGSGSNLLIHDSGVFDPVIRLGRGFKYVTPGQASGEFIIGGAVSLMTVCRELSESGFSGLEFAGGIPASVGGAVRMNAGAHGGEMVQILRSIEFITKEGERQRVRPDQLSYAYRRSGLPDGAVVTEASISLVAGDKAAIIAKRAHCLAERKARQPLSMPSAGSVFKNPTPEKSAGLLVEQAGLRGREEGGAQISPMHGNWIVNPKRQATAEQVEALIALCKREVKEKFGFEMHTEIISW